MKIILGFAAIAVSAIVVLYVFCAVLTSVERSEHGCMSNKKGREERERKKWQRVKRSSATS